jgi:hypothetical protein
MISLLEILRVNKPIIIEVDWNDNEYDFLFGVSSIIINGEELELMALSMFDNNAFYDGNNNLFVINTHAEKDEVRINKILMSNKIGFSEAYGSFDISSDYFQISNPR